MTDKEIEVIVKTLFTKMYDLDFSACEFGIECYKKGMEYQGIKELAIENENLIKQRNQLEAVNTELKEDLRNKKLAIKNRNGRIKELEEKISVLLSCKNCPENKGGYICEKEYEDKCLAQKMQYIKELQAENAELKEFYENEYFQISDRTADEKIKELEKHQVEVTIDDYSPYDPNTWGDMHEEWFVPKEEVRDLLKENYALITKAKELLNEFMRISKASDEDFEHDYSELIADAEQFLKEVEEC